MHNIFINIKKKTENSYILYLVGEVDNISSYSCSLQNLRLLHWICSYPNFTNAKLIIGFRPLFSNTVIRNPVHLSILFMTTIRISKIAIIYPFSLQIRGVPLPTIFLFICLLWELKLSYIWKGVHYRKRS